MPRYAPVMTMADLKDLIVDDALKNDYEEDYGPLDRSNADIEQVVYRLLNGEKDHIKISTDLRKIDVSTENVLLEAERMTKDGVPYLEMRIGGDWECPVVAIVYYDGKNLRGYIPTKGNSYNHKAKAAFGNDEEGDPIEAKRQFGKENYEHGDQISPDMTEVASDIEARIEARGTYARDPNKVIVSSAAKQAKADAKQVRKIADKEAGLDLTGPITSDLVYYTAFNVAGAHSFLGFNIRASDRGLTRDEINRLAGIPPQFELCDFAGYRLWRSKEECAVTGPQACDLMDAAGFTMHPLGQRPPEPQVRAPHS